MAEQRTEQAMKDRQITSVHANLLLVAMVLVKRNQGQGVPQSVSGLGEVGREA